MVAIEFQVKIKDGVIEIPPEYQEQLRRESGNAEVRVIVMAGDQPAMSADANDLIGRLLKNPLPVPHFVPLSREEAHRRN